MGPMSAGWPYTWTGAIARVLGLGYARLHGYGRPVERERRVDRLHDGDDVAALAAVRQGLVSTTNAMEEVSADVLQRLPDRNGGTRDVPVSNLEVVLAER